MILFRMAAWIGLSLAIIAVEVRLGHPSSDQRPVNRLTDQLMSLATMATLAGGLAGSLVLGFGSIQPGWASLALGLFLGTLGLVLRAASMRTLGRFYTLTPGIEPGQTLITTGPYRLVRHPGYLAILLSLGGLQLVLGTWVALAAMVLVILPLPVRIAIEERILAEHFSAEYADYRRRTPYRLVPGIV
jgi:protein-S-isoprenylcysteine O-methyltransferase Ste14